MRQLLVLILLSLSVLGQTSKQSTPSTAELVQQFKDTNNFLQQFEIAKQIVALHDKSVLPQLAGRLSDTDRHLRGNAAFIFAGLGDQRGIEVIADILTDRSDRPQGQGQATGSSDGQFHLESQIRADRYYAVHLFGVLRDPHAVSILIPLLDDPALSLNTA